MKEFFATLATILSSLALIFVGMLMIAKENTEYKILLNVVGYLAILMGVFGLGILYAVKRKSK